MDVLFAQRRRVRSPVGAGLFYPDDKVEMLKLLESYGMGNAEFGQAKAIIAPHGAWSYSGAIAADTFTAAMGRNSSIKKVVILGPIHDKREKGLFLSNSHSFYTPLGNVLVDRKLSEQLGNSGDSFEINDIPHLGEHSIEILLPFVKYCFPRASIIPVLMGQPGAQYIYDLSQGLKSVILPIVDETLIVISCNLSCNKDERSAKLIAEETLSLFADMNAPALTSAILEGRLNACGGALVVSLLESGILDKNSCCVKKTLLNAVNTENNIVYYSGLSFS